MTRKELKKLDAKFLQWVKTQPSCISGQFSDWIDGVGYCDPAHVRTAKNAGVGMKPYFSAIPLTRAEHLDQHRHGETYILPEHMIYEAGLTLAHDWFLVQAEYYRQRFMAETGLTIPAEYITTMGEQS